MRYAAIVVLAAVFAATPAFGKDKPPLVYVPATLLGFQTISTESKSTATPHTFTMGGQTFNMPTTVNTRDRLIRVYQLQIGDVLYSVRGNDTLKDHTVGNTISVSVNEKENTLYVLGKNGKSDGCKIMGETKVPEPEKKN
jgi:hypothetical protein